MRNKGTQAKNYTLILIALVARTAMIVHYNLMFGLL